MPEYKTIKNSRGEYEKVPVEAPAPAPTPSLPNGDDISIDGLLKSGLGAIERLLKILWKDISAGSPDRATVQNLKDCVAMLLELKKKEDDLLDKLSNSELEKLTDKTT